MKENGGDRRGGKRWNEAGEVVVDGGMAGVAELMWDGGVVNGEEGE